LRLETAKSRPRKPVERLCVADSWLLGFPGRGTEAAKSPTSHAVCAPGCSSHVSHAGRRGSSRRVNGWMEGAGVSRGYVLASDGWAWALNPHELSMRNRPRIKCGERGRIHGLKADTRRVLKRVVPRDRSTSRRDQDRRARCQAVVHQFHVRGVTLAGRRTAREGCSAGRAIPLKRPPRIGECSGSRSRLTRTAGGSRVRQRGADARQGFPPLRPKRRVGAPGFVRRLVLGLGLGPKAEARMDSDRQLGTNQVTGGRVRGPRMLAPAKDAV